MKCQWCLGFKEYEDYHDTEWGVPVYDDHVHFEFMVLESAQAGLSWATILKRRANYKEAYKNFDAVEVSKFSEDDIKRLMENTGIIRNRKKIEASVNNAVRFLEVANEFGTFSKYIWSFVDFKPIINKYATIEEIPAKTEISEELARDLKKRGFKFLGPVIMYSHMQATGLVNDHIMSCDRYKELSKVKASKIKSV